jgi:lipoic acid synthetase
MLATKNATLRLPEVFRKKLGAMHDRSDVYRVLRHQKLNTVCEEARCPNIGECFSNKTATFMILGDRCTRRCHFCSVQTGKGARPDPSEPENLISAIQSLGLDHVVITSVDRDDLPDAGAGHFALCISLIKKQLPHVTVELLTPDFKGKEALIDIVLDAKPDIWGHNIETVSRLYRRVRPQSHFETTCSVLRYVASTGTHTKSGMMVGLGENDDEISVNLQLLRELGVQVVTIGQYLRPNLSNWPGERYVESDSYARWTREGMALGFRNVFAGPFVRSSYHAKETHNPTISHA